MLIRDNISYKRRNDLENTFISSVWIEVSISSKKSILICSYYRQWSLPSELGIEKSGDRSLQINRYGQFAKQIEKAILL